MITNFIKVAALLVLASGCASLPPIGALEGPIKMSETVSSKEEAREALKTIRDSSLFPEQNLLDVEVTDFNFTLKGSPVKYREQSSRGRATNVDVFGKDVAVGSAESSAVEHEVNANRTIWFKDIVSIQVTETQVFEYDTRNNASIKVNGDFRCLVLLKEGKVWEIFSTSSGAIQRLAQALKLISGADLLPYGDVGGRCKCILRKDGLILGLAPNGELQKANVRLFDKVESIDGDSVELPDLAKTLEPGRHKFVVHPYDGIWSRAVEVNLGAE